MITQARLGLRLQRFEVIAVLVATAIVGLSALIVRWRLDSIGVPGACWDQWFGSAGQGTTECTSLAGAFLGINEEEAGKVMAGMAILPLFVGVFLGVPIVAREIEGGTAPTVWALAGSRARWLAGRLIPVLALLFLTLGFLAIASDVLWLGREPWGATPNFRDVGLHGPGVVARGLATLGLAVLAGTVMGRVLPAVIVGVVLCFVLTAGWGIVYGSWVQAEAMRHVRPIPADINSSEDVFPGGTYFLDGWKGPDGSLALTWDEIRALTPAGADPDTWAWDGGAEAAGYERVMAGVPGSAYATWSLIETVVLGGLGIIGLALAFPIVERRRPQ